MSLILPVEFKEYVPNRHRETLLRRYQDYVKEVQILFYSRNLQKILAEWVSCGNDPFTTNRFGLYDTSKQEYLDFIRGEKKVFQLMQIMFTSRACALCSYNQYQEPCPQAGGVEIEFEGDYLFLRAADLIDTAKDALFRPYHQK